MVQCRIPLEGDLQNRVCGIITMKLGHDGSMMQPELQRGKVDRDSEFDTTGCYAQHIQQIERYPSPSRLLVSYSNDSVCLNKKLALSS